MERRKYTVEKAKQHYKHIQARFKIDENGNLVARTIPVTPGYGSRKREMRNKSLNLNKSLNFSRSKVPYVSNTISSDYPIDVFNHDTRKAFYQFTYARNKSFYGNSSVSYKSNLNKTSPGLRMSNFKSEEDEPRRED